MNVILYSSVFCPRCRASQQHLRMLQEKYPQMTIEVKDVFAHPLAPLKKKIWMIPAVSCGDKKMSGFILSKEKLDAFLSECASK